MLKQKNVLEIKKGERVYEFIFELSSEAGEIHDVLHQMKSYVVDVINKHAEQEKNKEKEVNASDHS